MSTYVSTADGNHGIIRRDYDLLDEINLTPTILCMDGPKRRLSIQQKAHYVNIGVTTCDI